MVYNINFKKQLFLKTMKYFHNLELLHDIKIMCNESTHFCFLKQKKNFLKINCIEHVYSSLMKHLITLTTGVCQSSKSSSRFSISSTSSWRLSIFASCSFSGFFISPESIFVFKSSTCFNFFFKFLIFFSMAALSLA